MPVQESQLARLKSVRRRSTNLQVGEVFVIIYSIFALECFCVLLLHTWHLCYEISEWSTLNGLFRCSFETEQVSGF